MNPKRDPRYAWLARKLGHPENGAVCWNGSGKLYIQWIAPDGSAIRGCMAPRLARLMAKRINEALDA